jgi:hypothetical protein
MYDEFYEGKKGMKHDANEPDASCAGVSVDLGNGKRSGTATTSPSCAAVEIQTNEFRI